MAARRRKVAMAGAGRLIMISVHPEKFVMTVANAGK